MAAVQFQSGTRNTVVSFLLYGVVHGDRAEPSKKLSFAGYPRASIVARTGRLAAVVSPLSPADADPDVARLLVYAKIIESFNNERTVIPMRYGCRFPTIGDIVQFLKRGQNTFSAMLDELDGRVEMSAEVACYEPPTTRIEITSSLLATAPVSGIGFLAERRRHYSQLDESLERRENLRKSIYAMVKGKFIRAIPEPSKQDKKPSITIHFLVARESVAEFVGSLQTESPASIKVSGPWPPYNFVSTQHRSLAV